LLSAHRSCKRRLHGDVVVRSLKTRVNDVIQPRFDALSSLPTNLSQYRPVIVDGLDRIASGLEFMRASLAKLDQPIRLARNEFIQLNNSQSTNAQRYSMVGLDFKLSQSQRLPYR